MNLRFLGDALDHWKGSVFEYLQTENVLRNFLVDPMATDASVWKTEDSMLFARLLKIDERQLVQHSHNLRQDRKQYFAEIPRAGDVFLDPDTGIKTGRVKQLEQYLLPTELFDAIEVEEDRLVIVYQHIRAKETRLRLEKVLDTLKEQKRPFACSSYESGTVALLFFSRTAGRVEVVRNCFRRLLGVHSSNRVGYWNSTSVVRAT